MKEHALQYLELGMNVMPVKRDKKPLLTTWAEYQTKKVTTALVDKWWYTWPDANIAIITGQTSGIIVIDADSENGLLELDKIDSTIKPTVKTPNGWHYYFNCNGDMPGNATRFIPDCDVRGQGGYVVAPPSVNENGIEYKLLEPLDHLEALPQAMLLIINSSSRYIGTNGAEAHKGTQRHILLQHGTRGEDLFHIANCLIKGKMGGDNTRKVLEIVARSCDPPFEEKEIKARVDSAIKRNDAVTGTITGELRCYIKAQKGHITTTSCYNLLHCQSKEEKKAVRTALGRFKDEKLIEPTGRNVGEYRVIADMSPILSMTDETEIKDYAKLWLPFELDRMVKIPHGSLILLAGSPNAGKTTILMNCLRYNMKKWDVRYLSTEISHFEFKERAKDFKDLSKEDWKVKFQEDLSRETLVDHITGSNKNTLWLVDYVEVYEKFWEIGSILRDLHSKLHGGVMIATSQKNKGRAEAYGGTFTEMKPQLVVLVDWNYQEDHGKAEINKAKIIKKEHRENYGHPIGKNYLWEWRDGIGIKQKRWWTRAEIGEQK